jgi:hypothetical protein
LSNSWRRISSINGQPSWHGQTRFQAFSSPLAAGTDEKEQIDGAKPHPVSGSAADLQSYSGPPAPKLARETNLEKKARTFGPWSHLVSLLHAQLTHGT